MGKKNISKNMIKNCTFLKGSAKKGCLQVADSFPSSQDSKGYDLLTQCAQLVVMGDLSCKTVL